MTASASFTADHHAAIETLRSDLSEHIMAEVVTEYGATDCGQHWAALTVEALPLGAFGRPGPLVSVLRGHGVPGAAVIMGADGATLVAVKTEAGLDMALRVAKDAGVRTYTEMVEGVMAIH